MLEINVSNVGFVVNVVEHVTAFHHDSDAFSLKQKNFFERNNFNKKGKHKNN